MTDALKLENQLCFAVHSTAHAIARSYRPLLDPIGITYPQYLVLLVLWEQDELTVSEIGARLLLDSGTLTPLLKRLEATGYITRRRTRRDERQVEVSLTAAGKDLKTQAICIPERMATAMGQPLDELLHLKRQLDILRTNLIGDELDD
jgi:DNA-binding MarR family transcriptional regulator